MSPPTDNMPSPRKRADFPQVFRHERTLANRLRETNHGSTAPPPERCPRQEPLGRNGPPAFTLCHRASGPFRDPFALPSQWIQGREVEMTVPCQTEPIVLVFTVARLDLMTKQCGGQTAALTAEKTSECLLLTTKRLSSSSESGSCTS